VSEVQDRIDERYVYHRPTPEQTERYGRLRAKAKEFAELVAAYCPDSPERETAFTRIDEAVMHANASIARHEEGG